MVAANGNVTRGSEGVAATRINTGDYRVNFGRDMNACGFTGTQHVVTPPTQVGPVGLRVDATNPNVLFVRTTDSGGTSADRQFTVQVTC